MDPFSKDYVAAPPREKYTTSECRTCASCCHHPTPQWVRLDLSIDTKIPAGLVETVGGSEEHPEHAEHWMRHEKGRCAALLDDGAGFFTCSIYDDRPFTCRNFEIDGPLCGAERSRKLAQIRLLAK